MEKELRYYRDKWVNFYNRLIPRKRKKLR